MKIQAMLDWSSDEKAAKVKEWTQSLFTLRLQKATGQLENPMKIKQLRKDIARLKTAQHMGAAEVAAAAAHEVAPAHTEGSEETGTKTSSSGKSAAATRSRRLTPLRRARARRSARRGEGHEEDGRRRRARPMHLLRNLLLPLPALPPRRRLPSKSKSASAKKSKKK